MKRLTAMTVMAALMFSLLAGVPVSAPAQGAAPTLTGHWASAEFGGLDFVQTGASFTASWAGVSVSGVITGNSAAFSYWQGASFEMCGDGQRGRGSFSVSEDGAILEGRWANLDAKEPESGSFSAVRAGSPANAAGDAAPDGTQEEDLAQYQTEASEGIDALRVPLPSDLEGAVPGQVPAGTGDEPLRLFLEEMDRALEELTAALQGFIRTVLQAVGALRYPELPPLEIKE